jgi:hypothetical protein
MPIFRLPLGNVKPKLGVPRRRGLQRFFLRLRRIA